MPNVSYRDIAEKAGVSQMTVSLALRNHPRIPASTRRRVTRAAKALGYVRDTKVGELMNYLRSRRERRDLTPVAFLNAYAVPAVEKSDPYSRSLYLGAASRAEELGIRLEPFWLHEPGRSQARLARMLEHRGFRGLLISPLDPKAPEFAFDCRSFTAVTTSYSAFFLGFNQVLTNRLQGLQLSTERLLDLGFKRIGMIVDDDLDFRSRHMATAYFSWFQQQLPARQRVPVWREAVLTRRGFLRWFRRHRPDVVLTSPIEPYRWLREEGLRVPGDVAYATLCVSSYDEPGLSGIDERPDRIGAVALETLAAQIHLNESGLPRLHRLIGLDGEWRQGDTVRPASV